MKKVFLIFCPIFLLGVFNANAADSTAVKAKQQEQLEIYRTALNYNDLGTAAHALVTYLNSNGSINYKDSLALVYYDMNNLAGAFKLANEMYERNNKSVPALTLLADITGRGRDAKLSLEWYEKLCAVNPQPYNWYQLATKQFVLERKMECKQSLQKVIADSANAGKQTVTLDIGNNYSENVPVVAASYNMLAVIAYQDKNTEEAKALYGKALKIFPDFVIAKQNLETLNKPAGAPTKAKPKTK